MPNRPRPVAVVTGASAGLGFSVAKAFLAAGYDVVGVARDQNRLHSAATSLRGTQTGGLTNPEVAEPRFMAVAGDVTDSESLAKVFTTIREDAGRIDALVNCVGQSDRGATQLLTRQKIIELIDANVISSLLVSQAALPLLRESKGVVVNVGSLASRVGARYLGGYPLTKHALAGLTQQMRLEWREFGVHVALICPGPISRPDAGTRYDSQVTEGGAPESAKRPGGGAKIKGLAPEYVARKIVQMVRKRTPDTILPWYARCLIVLGHLSPPLGDRLVLAMTGGKK